MTASARRPFAARLARLLALAALAALAGCGTLIEARFDPALFPRTAAAPRFDGRAAVLTDPVSLKMTVTGSGCTTYRPRRFRCRSAASRTKRR